MNSFFDFLENDEIYFFGGNAVGQLGIGNDIEQTTPQLISYFKNMKINFISCGCAHAFVSTSNHNISIFNYFLKKMMDSVDSVSMKLVN